MTNKNADNTAKKQQKRVIGKPFEKGQSGNPAGRPKGSISIVAELKKKLEEVPKENNPDKKRYVDMLVLTAIKKVLVDGDTQMIKDIIDRVDGRPNQPIESDLNITMIEANKAKEALKNILNRSLENDKP